MIGGSGPLESELRSQAVALGVADSIVWPGHVLNMPRFLSALDVFVSPATTEAFGIALIEAAAAGVPTIATRVGGVPEVILDGETGLLVAAARPERARAGDRRAARRPPHRHQARRARAPPRDHGVLAGRDGRGHARGVRGRAARGRRRGGTARSDGDAR